MTNQHFRKIRIGDLLINLIILKPGSGNQGLFLILHGWGSKAERWLTVGKVLTKNGYQVIIPDLPGFGESEKPASAWNTEDYSLFVESLVKTLNLNRFFLLGHSFGGSVAIKYAIKSPQKIKKLFLVASAGLRRPSFKKTFLNKISKLFKLFSFLPFYPLIRKIFYRFIVRKSDYLSTEGVMKDTFLKVLQDDLSEIISKIQIPTVIIWGEKDDIVPLKDAYFLKNRIQNSKLEIIPNGDHCLEQKSVETLSQKILENI